MKQVSSKLILLILAMVGLAACAPSVSPVKSFTPTDPPSPQTTASPTLEPKAAGLSAQKHTPIESTLTIKSSPTPKPSFTPKPSPAHLPQIISKLKLNCTQQDAYARCMDEVLNIEFEYPIAWGEIEAVLRTGGYTGYAYDYYYGGRTMAEMEPLVAGGRSIDFTEGRGGMPTDFWGFGERDSQDRCAQIHDFYPICQEVKPNVVWMMRFPDSDYFCEQLSAEEFEQFTFQPVVRIEIDFAQNSKIHGFVFEALFLSEGLSQELDNSLLPHLGLRPDAKALSCFSESRGAFDLAVQDFIQRVESGQLDSETLENLDKLRHLATSITFHPVPLGQLPEADQVIFTIPNTEPWSGREGDPRPDWKGWGVETFTLAPDGTFWIADTAVLPNRFLQDNHQGELLQEISLDSAFAIYSLRETGSASFTNF